MSSSTDLSNSNLNVESSERTHTTFGSGRDISGWNQTVDPRSDCASYEWVNPCVLDIPTCFRGPNDLDKFLSTSWNLICPQTQWLPIVLATPTECAIVGKTLLKTSFLFTTHFLTTYMLLSPSMNLPWGPSDR